MLASKKSSKIKYIIGIDEAGRGPLAGPVAVGLVIAPISFSNKKLKNIKDSKQLSEHERELWFKKLQDFKKNKELNFSVTLVNASVIDKKGISFAINFAIKLCLKKVKAKSIECLVVLDGSLKAPEQFKMQQTIIKGDEKIPLISLASIAAKVTRDREMKQLAIIYPNYLFEIHKGYGTAKHRKNIIKYGFCAIHRQTFCRNLKA